MMQQKNNRMPDLLSALEAYAKQNIVPMHMPGHKRRDNFFGGVLPYAIDISEIAGFDNLQHPTGVLKTVEDRASAYFGAEHTFLSVNGSTGALLAAIDAACPRGSSILVARNCHQSVFHAVELLDLRPVWLEPSSCSSGFFGSVAPGAIEAALQRCPSARLCVLTSPTYEGVFSNTKSIAELLHAQSIPLLVDAAHGTDIPNHADLIAQSLHKHLPALTQTALLHCNGNLIAPEALQHAMCLFQTTSPSYVLLASIDRCISILSQTGERLFANLDAQINLFRAQANHWQFLSLFDGAACYAFDNRKLLLNTSRTVFSAEEAAAMLRKNHVEPEYAAGDSVLLLPSVFSSQADFAHTAAACNALDQPKTGIRSLPAKPYPLLGEWVLPIAEALRRPQKKIPANQTVGQICGAYLVPYPPGVPLAVPGVRVTPELADYLGDEDLSVLL